MKKFTRKLMVSIIAVMFAVLALGTSTFAWFNLTNTVTLGTINLDVAGGPGLEIQVNGKGYKNRLSADDIAKEVGTNVELIGVTSTDLVTYKLISNEAAAINKDYIKFTLGFKASLVPSTMLNGNDYIGVYLTNFEDTTYTTADTSANKTYLVSKGVSWVPTITYKEEAEKEVKPSDAAVTKYAADAVRIGFKYDDTDASLAQKKIFDFGSDSDRGYGYEYGAYDFYVKKTNAIMPSPSPSAQSVVVVNSTADGLTETFDFNGVADDNNSLVCILKEDAAFSGTNKVYTGEVVVTIWLEGWDGDCFDAIFADKIIGQLSFVIAGVAD